MSVSEQGKLISVASLALEGEGSILGWLYTMKTFAE